MSDEPSMAVAERIDHVEDRIRERDLCQNGGSNAIEKTRRPNTSTA